MTISVIRYYKPNAECRRVGLANWNCLTSQHSKGQEWPVEFGEGGVSFYLRCSVVYYAS